MQLMHALTPNSLGCQMGAQLSAEIAADLAQTPGRDADITTPDAVDLRFAGTALPSHSGDPEPDVLSQSATAAFSF
jgi:hypothetical protein